MGDIVEDIVDFGADLVDGAVDLVDDVISWIIPRKTFQTLGKYKLT